jgi:hypothetical protein
MVDSTVKRRLAVCRSKSTLSAASWSRKGDVFRAYPAAQVIGPKRIHQNHNDMARRTVHNSRLRHAGECRDKAPEGAA